MVYLIYKPKLIFCFACGAVLKLENAYKTYSIYPKQVYYCNYDCQRKIQTRYSASDEFYWDFAENKK